ncbi:MAG: ribonuclease P protein component [Bacilli bacterium]|nr:ribonuclease P protein component [Bacilli bacterium]
MKKKNIVKENKDFSKIINNGKKCWNDAYSIYYDENNYGNYRIGISVSKKIGNAVVRNKIKRQIRNIADKYKNIYQKNRDYIIIVRRNYINLNFYELEIKYLELINKITHRGELQ